MIYLDNSATTFPKPEEFYKALDCANRNLAFNAGRGSYKKAVEATKIIDETREQIGSFVNLPGSCVAFTSSATESLNLIINGLGFEDGDNIYISPFEHNSIVRPLYRLKELKNINILIIPFDKVTWKPDLTKLEEMFSISRPKAIFVSQVSNVTGLILDYKDLFESAKKYDAITILDSAQSYGILNPNMDNVDFCVFAGHKSLYASFGVAGIISRKFSILNVTKSGGNGSDSLNHNMPKKGYARIESGSPNIVAIYGLLNSAKRLKTQDCVERERHLTNYLIDQLKKVKKIILYLPKNIETLGIVSFNIEGYESNDVANILSEDFDICVRSGYHCSPFVHEFIDSIKFKGTVRISLGLFNTEKDIKLLIDALKTF